MKQLNVTAFAWEKASSTVSNAAHRLLAGISRKTFFNSLFPLLFLGLSFAVSFNASANSTTPPSKKVTAFASLTADLALVKTVNDNTPDQNQVITFTLVVSNAGPDPATSFEVTDVVPTGMTYVVGSMTGPGTYVNGAPATTGLKWQNLFLQNGGSLVLSFQATVTAAGGTIITNFAQVTASAEADPDSTPNNGNIGEDDGDVETVTVNVANPPVVLTCPTNTTVAACQTQAAVNAAFNTWLATASGSGGCSGVLTNNNTGAPPACGGSTTVTFTYTSTCAPLITTCNATFTVPAAPSVVLTCPINLTSAACQTQAAVDAAFATWLATASASGGCNGALSNNNTGAPPACGGSTTVTFTYTSSCAPLTTTCNATFTVSAPASPTPVFANCTNNTINLGCNPSNLPSCAGIASGGFGGAVTASNSCGSVPVTCSAGSITINGCARTQVFTFEATACGLTVTCTRTFTWTQVTPPSFNGTCGNGVTNLGCNPATLPACDPNVTASNECGPVTVTCNVGAIIVNGCNRQQTLLYVANAPGCGTFSTCQRVFNWQVTTAPVFGNCDNTIDLGCNPATLPSCANINQAAFGGAITATNECGNVTMSCTPGPITSNGCNRTQIFTISATACGLTSTCTRTFTWTVATAPVFDNCTSGTTDLGCNPAVLPSCDAGITATNECGAVTVTCTPGAITSNGCDRSQVFTYTATACGLTSTCARTFTWKINTTPVLNCPTNTTVAACQTQAAVNGQFAAWLATASFSGGCGAVLTNNNTGAPSFCGGSATVTFTLNSDCQSPVTCQATFTVTAAPPPSLTCPNPLIRPVCQTRAQDSIAMQNWVNTSSFGGGCNGSISYNGFDGRPPSSCGGTKTLTLTYTSSCAAPLTCTSTFTIPAPTAPVLTCPTNQSEPFGQTQAQINAAFATWLATASGTGGCNGVLSNNNVGAPPATGGSTTVTFTYAQNPPSTPFSGACPFSTLTCQATFTVSATPPAVLTCPVNTTTAACQTQAAVNAAFATWLATASGTGGCNGVLTNNNTGGPAACGGSTTVTFTYTSTCAPLTTTCQATFTVAAPPNMTISCPVPTTVAACQTQAAVNAQFAAWLATVNGQGGCGYFIEDDAGGTAPSACGGSKTVTYTAHSDCAPFTMTCQSTFTVTAAPPVVLTCPTNTTAAACQTQAAVNTAFATWLATATASGGCNGVLTNNNTGAPAACGGSTTVTFTYTSACAPLTTTCQATFTVAAPPNMT
ncbi:MAG: DUF11 domain-containing protein, partial [Saprospiraceae bacterium]|nr:DUF11 domain-containing protein [Saprospiraceae bacterium]